MLTRDAFAVANLLLMLLLTRRPAKTDTRPFQTSPASQSVMVNDTVSLDCLTGFSAPPADVHWLHNGQRMTAGDQAVSEFGSRRDGGVAGRRNASLMLQTASFDDRGLYRCVAVNPASGTVVRSLEAVVNVTGTAHHIPPASHFFIKHHVESR